MTNGVISNALSLDQLDFIADIRKTLSKNAEHNLEHLFFVGVSPMCKNGTVTVAGEVAGAAPQCMQAAIVLVEEVLTSIKKQVNCHCAKCVQQEMIVTLIIDMMKSVSFHLHTGDSNDNT